MAINNYKEDRVIGIMYPLTDDTIHARKQNFKNLEKAVKSKFVCKPVLSHLIGFALEFNEARLSKTSNMLIISQSELIGKLRTLFPDITKERFTA